MNQGRIGVGDADVAGFVVGADPIAQKLAVGVRGVLSEALQQAQRDQGVGAGFAHDFAKQVAGPGAEAFAGVHQGYRPGQVTAAGGVGAIEVGQPVVHRRRGQVHGSEAFVQDGFAAQLFDQQVGGAVVAHPNHLRGRLKEGKARTNWPAGHPAGSAAHQFLGQGEGIVPAQLAAVEVFEARQQDRRLDRAGGGQGQVGLELGVAAIVEHQQEAAGGEIFVDCGQLAPALAQGCQLGAGLK